MGRKKNKLVKKTVNFYKYVFKFDPPFNVVLDGNFIAVAKKKKFDIKDIIQKTLDEKVHLVITSCIVNELREFESKIPGLLDLIMNYKIEDCAHKDLTPEACIKSMIGHKNKKKYFVATQDVLLRNQLRKSIAVPLLFFDQNMLLIEKISRTTMESYDRRENLKVEPKKFEKETISKEKSEIKEFMIDEYKKTKHYKKKLENYKINKVMGRIKKKAKGPNPLSCKKKKTYHERRNNIKKIESSNGPNEYKTNFPEFKNVENLQISEKKELETQEFLKKKRKRKRKNKENQ